MMYTYLSLPYNHPSDVLRMIRRQCLYVLQLWKLLYPLSLPTGIATDICSIYLKWNTRFLVNIFCNLGSTLICWFQVLFTNTNHVCRFSIFIKNQIHGIVKLGNLLFVAVISCFIFVNSNIGQLLWHQVSLSPDVGLVITSFNVHVERIVAW